MSVAGGPLDVELADPEDVAACDPDADSELAAGWLALDVGLLADVPPLQAVSSTKTTDDTRSRSRVTPKSWSASPESYLRAERLRWMTRSTAIASGGSEVRRSTRL
jgi:hypothetical protein